MEVRANVEPAVSRSAWPAVWPAVWRGATVVGAIVVVVGSFRPWLASGRVERSSYELFRLVDRLGHAPEGPLAMALRVWPVVPLALAVAVVAVWGDRAVLATSIGVVVGAWVTAVAVIVRAAPAEGSVRVLAGPTVTALGGIVLLAGAIGWATVSATARARSGPRAARAARRS